MAENWIFIDLLQHFKYARKGHFEPNTDFLRAHSVLYFY